MPGVPDGQKLSGIPVHARRMTIVVTAAVIERDGRFLVTRRQRGVHLEGYWEFPGGKCDPGETLIACLARELHEELAVEATIGAEILATTHAYPERTVELHFFRCEVHAEPAPQIGQEMRWIRRDDLRRLAFPPADSELIDLLTEPPPRA
jgi:mutator protein MutT